MKIAVDAMGGDNAPGAIVEGALLAAKEFPEMTIQLYGKSEEIAPYLKNERPSNIEIIHCDQVIQFEDEPVKAVRRKKQSSMMVAARAVKDGQADALVSAGNTGAILAAGTIIVGRIRGISRPALLGTLPNLTDPSHQFVLVDMGANADSKAKQFQQNALMGSRYAQEVLGIAQPRVGLLNNGTEDSKGNHLTKEAYALLKETEGIHFIGNVESRDLLGGVCDVVVSDGFTGNAVLKAIEGTATHLLQLLKTTIKSGDLKTKLGGLLIKGTLKEALQSFNPDMAGGATLFGVKAPVIKCHGNASAQTVLATLRQTYKIVNSGMYQALAEELKSMASVKEEERENE